MGNSLAIHIPRTWMWSHSLKNLEVSTFEIHGKLILAQWDRESMVEICQIPAEELNYEILTAFGVINNNSYQGGRLGGHAHISSMPPVSERAVWGDHPEHTATATWMNSLVFPHNVSVYWITRISRGTAGAMDPGMGMAWTMGIADFWRTEVNTLSRYCRLLGDHPIWKKGLPLIHPQILACSVDGRGI